MRGAIGQGRSGCAAAGSAADRPAGGSAPAGRSMVTLDGHQFHPHLARFTFDGLGIAGSDWFLMGPLYQRVYPRPLHMTRNSAIKGVKGSALIFPLLEEELELKPLLTRTKLFPIPS